MKHRCAERKDSRQGAFARPALPGVLTTMPPSDSRQGQGRVMDSPVPLTASDTLCGDHPGGSPRFLGWSFDARRPQPPRRARPLRVLVASRPVSGFITFGRLATLRFLHEAESGSLALRLTSSSHGASAAGSPRQPPDRLHGERAITMISTFQLTQPTRLRLAHQRNGGTQRVLLLCALRFFALLEQVSFDRKCTMSDQELGDTKDERRRVARPGSQRMGVANHQNATPLMTSRTFHQPSRRCLWRDFAA
jgi:hypothetical protein